MAGYNWLEHDGRTAGTQVINDIENNVQIKVYLLKTPSGSSGGSWAARIGGQPLDPSESIHPSRLCSLPLTLSCMKVVHLAYR